MKIYKNKLDLLIIDIDDTFIYHRTVASANKIFLNSLCDFSIKRIIRLAKTGIYLHILNIIRKINNRFFKVVSCEKMIRIWADTVINLKIKAEDYEIPEKVIKRDIYKNVFDIYNQLNTKYVLAMTESFNVKEDPIKDILGIDEIISNQFISDKGIIVKYKINISKGKDKKRIAEKVIKKIKAKNIGIFIEEYDDLELLKLKNLRFIAYNKRLKRFIPNYITSVSF